MSISGTCQSTRGQYKISYSSDMYAAFLYFFKLDSLELLFYYKSQQIVLIKLDNKYKLAVKCIM